MALRKTCEMNLDAQVVLDRDWISWNCFRLAERLNLRRGDGSATPTFRRPGCCLRLRGLDIFFELQGDDQPKQQDAEPQ